MNAPRTGYDLIADKYAEAFRAEVDSRPLDRALVTAFGELVGSGPVLDVGCGPGWITAKLRAQGLDARGIDLSAGMLAQARVEFPGLPVEQASMTALPRADRSLAGLVAWYSVIHIEPARRPAVFAEFHRVLRPGAPLLLAFQMGDEEPLRLDEAFGRRIDLVFHRMNPDRVAEELTGAGFTMTARIQREKLPEERVPQAFLLATA
ncbi:SAM-dependent methyltransferase [Crossiella equi]|uniref:SAM-dependent methyltransferase n=1 Tax=Crossiella equi TaxID=130796 RepID=A0ABS5ARW5_9PSEU|nr:class I SAM-dependent methyltransferase [Crossiella equi]MBP2479306.1 SAM-dependent methyltransferase [Crossiella equi]